MKQKIKLTKENDGTIHVDDVDVSKGVYFKWDTGEIHYILLSEAGYFTINPQGEKTSTFLDKTSFLQFVNDFKSTCGGVYTLSGLRIVTEKELSVEDLKEEDHVGFIDDRENKGHIVCSDGTKKEFLAVTNNSVTSYGTTPKSMKNSIREALKIETVCRVYVVEAYRFTTRKELYAWLAE